jgi:hypothetical protein
MWDFNGKAVVESQVEEFEKRGINSIHKIS